MTENHLKPLAVRALLAQDHERLDGLFDDLSDALGANAREEARLLWTAFDEGLCEHMELEEKYVLPRLAEEEPVEAAALQREHDQIRARLVEFGVALDLHEIREATVNDFIAELRQHARREDELAYRWAERFLAESEQEQLRRRLDKTDVRHRLMALARRTRGQAPAER